VGACLEVFKYHLDRFSDKEAQITLSGYLDESAVLPERDIFDGLEKVIFDFDKCDVINSGGVKLWVVLMSHIEKLPQLKVIFKNCRPLILDQINLIESFLPANGEVQSLYILLFCEKCERELDVCREVSELSSDMGEVVSELKSVDCPDFPDCKSDIVLDMHPAKTLKFLKKD
jgi:hypothetical protein